MSKTTITLLTILSGICTAVISSDKAMSIIDKAIFRTKSVETSKSPIKTKIKEPNQTTNKENSQNSGNITQQNNSGSIKNINIKTVNGNTVNF